MCGVAGAVVAGGVIVPCFVLRALSLRVLLSCHVVSQLWLLCHSGCCHTMWYHSRDCCTVWCRSHGHRTACGVTVTAVMLCGVVVVVGVVMLCGVAVGGWAVVGPGGRGQLCGDWAAKDEVSRKKKNRKLHQQSKLA